MHIKIFNDATWEAAKAGIAAAGLDAEHAVLSATHSNTLAFVASLEKEFPDVYAAIKQGIADYKDKAMSGGDKAVAIASDVMKIVPEVAANITGIKDALVSAVTTLFSDEEASFKGIVKTEADKL